MPTVFARGNSAADRYEVVGTASGALTTSQTIISKMTGPDITGKTEEYTFSYDLAAGAVDATNTPLILCSLPAGTYDLSYVLNPSGTDLDSDSDFTFNLGTAASATAFLSASTGLQATTPVTGQPTRVTVGANETLRLARVAGELDSSGVLYGSIKITRP